jgi:uncharacterized protein involved in exopolysaccharide biosynthesis
MVMNPANKSKSVMQSKNAKDASEHKNQGLTDIDFSEYLKVIFKNRELIGYVIGTALIISIIVSLLLPKMYVATARIMPPPENKHGLSSFLTGVDNPLSGIAGSLIGTQTPASLYVGIMKSRSVADDMNQKFNLKKLYDLKYIEDVYKELASRSTLIISKKDNIISISVKDHDPQRAADMANAYVEMLDKTNRKLNITQGKRKRLFLEERLKEVRNDLGLAEVELKTFQEKYNLVAIEEQAKVAIEGAAEIKGQIIAAQTELEVLKQFGTEKQIEAVMLKAKIEELQKQLEAIENGEIHKQVNPNAKAADINTNFYIPFKELPRLGLQLVRLTREAKIQEKLFELLTSQYEMARIEEAKDLNTIQVLDTAVAPEKKISPKRTRIVITSSFFAFLIAVIIAIVKEYQWDFRKMLR